MQAKHVLFVIPLILLTISTQAKTLNGFDLSSASIPVEKIFRGGPPRDGIPSIDEPKFVQAENVEYLKDDDVVLGIDIDGEQRAYPLRILVWHEIVNDQIGDTALAITYCPLCGTAMVFDRRVNDSVLTFGVSGLLYQSDVLMFDRETESLWSQLGQHAINGAHQNQKLTWLPSLHMSWSEWKTRFPNSAVLSPETGYHRNYDGSAYADYFASEGTMFPVPIERRELPIKSWVIGVMVNGQAKAYVPELLPKGQPLIDSVGDDEIRVTYSAESQYAEVKDAQGNVLPSVMSFWFAWQAFYPETRLWPPNL